MGECVQISVFDLDHTLLTGNSSYHFGFYLYKRKFFNFRKLILCLCDYARHKCLGLSVQKLHVKSFSRLFQGQSLAILQEHVEAFLTENLQNLLYTPVAQRLREAHSRGETTLILSSGPDFLVSAIARRLDVTQWQATTYRADDEGRLAAITHVLEGQDKANYMQDYAKKMELPLSDFTVYSDSYLDLPIMRIAGRAIGVLPDNRLKYVCLQNGWEIIS